MNKLGNLTTEARNPASGNLDQMTAIEIVDLMNSQDFLATQAVQSQSAVIAQAIELIANRLRGDGRLIYMGAGTSGRLGVLDASECPPTFNTDPEKVIGLIAGGDTALRNSVEGAEDHPEFGRRDLEQLRLTPNDVVVGIATSGRTPYVVGGMEFARTIGAATIGLTCNQQNELEPVSDLLICPVVGPEVISGSTRMKAGTATKMILNMLTTGAMVRTGKTFGNLMVDLRSSNVKLKDRSLRIIHDLTGLDADAATQLLDRCQGQLKIAVVVHAKKISVGQAAERLRKSGGRLRQALMEDLE